MGKIQREKRIVEQMIRLYCRCKEGNEMLCPKCAELLQYAHTRLSYCPHGENKPTCRRCKIHCYSNVMRQRVRMVMRYSGPRMLMYRPISALRHLF